MCNSINGNLFLLLSLHLHSSRKLGELSSLSVLELRNGSLLGNLAVFYHSDSGALLDSCQAMGNHDRGASNHDFIEGGLYFALTLLVKGTCGFIKEEDVGLSNDGTSDCNPLLLASRQFGSSESSCDSVSLMELGLTLLLSSSLVEFVGNSYEFTCECLLDFKLV